MLRGMRRALAWFLAAAIGLVGCECGGEPTEGERLREQVDTSSVHLYVALKIGVSKTGDDPRITAVREQLLEALIRAVRLYERAQTGDATLFEPRIPDAGAGADAETDAGPADDGPTRMEQLTGGGADALALARALYELRGMGQDIVRERREDEIPPVLPVVIGAFDPGSALAAQIDSDSEHALLLMAFWVLKFHEKSPAPIPMEILLYEAWMTDPDEMGVAGLAPMARSIKAYVYGVNDYCDLAAIESAALADSDPEANRALLANATSTLGATALPEDDLRTLEGAVRGLAHGATGICYLGREDEDSAVVELERFCDAAEEFGIPPAELGLIRAWIAYKRDDLAAARQHLELARTSESIDERERERIDEVLRYFENDDRDAIDGLFDKAFFAALTVQLVFDQLERSGVAERFAESPVYKACYGFAVGSGRVVGDARQSIPSTEDVGEAAGSFFDHLGDWFGGDE